MTQPNTYGNIPIAVVNASKPDGLALAKALLNELHAMLETLIDKGQGGIIDLRALPPLGVEGYQFLREKLSAGEVSAHIHSFGRCDIQETVYPGIWWVTHLNQGDETLTEQIEVCFIPELLKSHRDDVSVGQGKLRELLQELSTDKG
jgi:hydrogenase-1 operon protein HyaF